ncbi:MAG: hypothetical protein Q9201_005966 [Fulgogasparrea decipioides]
MSSDLDAGSADTIAQNDMTGLEEGTDSVQGKQKDKAPPSSDEKIKALGTTNEVGMKPDIPPEGGTAGWLCVLGSAIGLFCTFGFLAAIGVFQTTYEQTSLKSYSPSDISWIFTVQLSLMWILGPVFGRVTDSYGPTPIMIPCSLLCIFSLCMLSLSTKYYQIFLSQGLGFGLGAGGIFTTCFVVSGQWFVKRRGLAVGIVTCGSSLGGVIFPFLVNELTKDIGFAGAMRYTALFEAVLLAAACILVKARLPRKKWNPDLRWFDFRLLVDKSFGLYTFGAFLVIAASVPGRIIPGAVGDKFGYFNVMTTVSTLTGISVFCLWVPFDYHRSQAAVIVFALAYGLVSGAYISLMMPCAAKSGSIETLGQRFGTFQSVVAIA